MAMTFIKSLAGALLLLILLLLVGWTRPQSSALGWLALSGLLGISAGDTFFFAALQRLGAHQLIIIMMLGPAVTVLMAVLVLGELPSLLAWIGIVLVLGGVSLTLFGDSRGGEQPTTMRTGIVFGLLCILSMAVSIIRSQTWLKPGFGLGRNISANGIWILRNAFFGFVPTKNRLLAAPAEARCIAGQVCSCGGGGHFWRVLVITGRGQTLWMCRSRIR